MCTKIIYRNYNRNVYSRSKLSMTNLDVLAVNYYSPKLMEETINGEYDYCR